MTAGAVSSVLDPNATRVKRGDQRELVKLL